MGGTKILAAALNSEDKIFARYKKDTKTDVKPKQHIKDISSAVKKLIKENDLSEKNLKAAAVGIPGSVNPVNGIIGLAPNLGLKNYPVKEKLEDALSLPVIIENDVNLAAIGIKEFELDEEDKNVLIIAIGTGIGGAVIINNKIYRGANYFAGEIGHMIVEENGKICGCGRRGCFEATASRSAIVKNIISDIEKGDDSILSGYNGKIKSRALLLAVNKMDEVAVKRIKEGARIIGLVTANLNNFLNFNKIVFAGGMIESLHNFMLPEIKNSFFENSLPDSAAGVKITATKLGDDAALYGSIPLANEFLGIKV
jgi:glucokinase